MKRIMTVVLMVVLMVSFGGTTVKAAESERKNENRVKREVSEYEHDIADALSENEAKARAIEYCVNYKEISKDIYDICVTFNIYKKYSYEYHFIYDALEDEDLLDYGINEYGKHIDMSKLDDYLYDKFPELR